jgi:hypothetical protein
VAALALVALMIAGCSNAPAETSGNNAATNHDQAVKFAECMRNNGVANFPDPNPSGGFTIDGVVNGSSLNIGSAAWQNAIGACKDLEPAGFMGTTRTAQQQENALKFAQCIRDNGVKDFPDPAADQPLIDTSRIPSTHQTGGMTILHAAMQKCRDLAAAAGVTGGQ